MTWIRRPRLEEALQRALAQPAPALVVVRGRPESGVSALLRHVAASSDRPVAALSATPGTGESHRTRFAEALARQGTAVEVDGPPEWDALVDALLDDLDRRRDARVLVIDDAPGLGGSAAEAGRVVARLWTGARSRALPLHLVLASTRQGDLDALLGQALEGADPHVVEVGPVRGDELREHLPDWSPDDRYLIQACLGSSVATLGRVDPGIRAATNLQRLVVDPEGPLHGRPPRRLREMVQKPERYTGVLVALARGARDWGQIRRANPAFRSGNQLAPYLSTLQDLGWVESERSLDAAPESRRRRYGPVDPFTAFWYGVVEPALGRLLEGEPAGRVWRDLPVDLHAAHQFPGACRRALVERGADVLPVAAREAGGLWGDGYELPVSGTLRNGAAVYGRCVWGRPATVADADTTTRHMRATRYGFGRQARLPTLFTAGGVTEPLVRRAARDPLLHLVPLTALF